MKSDWISVKDRLPDEDDWVWCIDNYKNKKGEQRRSVSMAAYESLDCDDCKKNHGSIGFRMIAASLGDCDAVLKNVTHWADLEYPDLPSEDGPTIFDLKISARATNPLKMVGLIFIKDVINKSDDELMKIHTFGRWCLDRTRKAIDLYIKNNPNIDIIE